MPSTRVFPPLPPPPPTQDRRQTELDQLRQRGLATLLHKHFTQVQESIMAERAAADEALRDLEARKAAGGTADKTNINSMTALDRVYMELQMKRDECRRKERGTMALYQRYVDKLGGSTSVPPLPPLTPLTQQDTADQESPEIMSQQNSVDQLPPLGGNSFIIKDKLGAFTTPPTRKQTVRANSPGMATPPSLDALTENSDYTPSSLINVTLPTFDSTLVEDESDTSTNVSGLTSMHDEAEQELLEFLRNETDVIRGMLEEEDVASVSSRSMLSEEGMKAEKAAEEAEQMVRDMQRMVQHATQSITTASREKKAGRPLPDVGLEGEEWVAYWCDEHGREYYHELKSNEVQWVKPEAKAGMTNNEEESVVVMDFSKKTKKKTPSRRKERAILTREEVVPESNTGRSSRRADEYRRRMQRQSRRRRRRIAFGVGALSAISVGLYYFKDYRPQSLLTWYSDNQSHQEGQVDTKKKAPQKEGVVSKTQAPKTEQVAPKIEDSKKEAKKEAPKKEQVASTKLPKEDIENKIEEDTGFTEWMSDFFTVVEEAEPNAKMEPKAKAESKAKIEPKAKVEPKVEKGQKASAAAEHSTEDVADLSRRPRGCFVPVFGHLFSKKCRQMAKEYPVFDLQEFSDSMME